MDTVSLTQMLLREKLPLFHLIYQFNVGLAEYTHASHLEGLISKELLDAVCKRESGARGLSRILLKHFSLEDSFCLDFEPVHRRLALVSEVTLQKLFFYAGAALLHERITHIIAKDELAQLKEDLGKNVYFFAVKRAPFLVSTRPGLSSLEAPSPNLFVDLIRAAEECFSWCFGGEPQEITQRLMLKFPKRLKWHFDNNPTPEEREAAWQFLHRILIKEVGPDWKSCFI